MNICKVILCRLFCPGYKERMPADAPGKYVAERYLYSRMIGGKTRVLEQVVEGRREAYRVARWLALRIDLSASHHPALSVHYAIRKLESGI